MKRKMIMMILTSVIALSIAGCGAKDEVKSDVSIQVESNSKEEKSTNDYGEKNDVSTGNDNDSKMSVVDQNVESIVEENDLEVNSNQGSLEINTEVNKKMIAGQSSEEVYESSRIVIATMFKPNPIADPSVIPEGTKRLEVDISISDWEYGSVKALLEPAAADWGDMRISFDAIDSNEWEGIIIDKNGDYTVCLDLEKAVESYNVGEFTRCKELMLSFKDVPVNHPSGYVTINAIRYYK